MLRLVCTVTVALMWLTTQAGAGVRVDLDGDWRFKVDPAAEGESAGWTKAIPAGTESVRVPHTWGIGRHEDHEGLAWYFRTFALPSELLGRHVEVHFGATFYRSRVWLNGQSLGGHEGGHTAYALDASGRVAAENLLVVELDNRPGVATIPGVALRLGRDSWYDWWHYGGIVRDAWLTAHDAALLRRQRIRTRVADGAALVSDRVVVENHSQVPLAAVVALSAVAPDGSIAARAEMPVRLAPGEQDVALDLRIQPVKLWHFDDPQVYSLEARLVAASGETLDAISDTFGARQLEIHERRLYLNGDRVRLSGVTRHEDSPWEGLAETPGTMRFDYDDLKALHVTLTRPVHYPQHPYILDYCDRNGILLIPEIPMWQFAEEQMADPRVVALAEQMMRELIEQAGNHPCVLAWSVCNESATQTPGGVAYVRRMRDFVRSLDPDRFVTYADDSVANAEDPRSTAAVLADFVMMNQYFGSWAGPAGLLPEKLERLGRLLPDKMIVISELGLAGLFASDSAAADEKRRALMREQMAEFAKHDFIGGAIFWCYQDYKSHRNLRPGETTGYVEMGLVDQLRQRRPSWALWRELNAPARVTVEWNETYVTPTAFRATVRPRGEGELPSYPLRGYRAEWEVQDDDNRVIARGAEALPALVSSCVFDGKWSNVSTKKLTLRFRLLRPTGLAAADERFVWWQPRAGGAPIR